MKKLLAIILVGVLIFSIVACTPTKPETPSESRQQEEPSNGSPSKGTDETDFSQLAVDENGEPYLLGYVTNENSSGWNSFSIMYMEGLWKSMGGKFVVYVSDYDLEKEVSMLNDLKQMSPDAIIVHPSDSYAIAPAVQSVLDDGIPVFAIDMGVIGADPKCFIYGEQEEMGRKCAQYIISQFSADNPGVVLEIAGGLEQDGAQKRQAGFHEIVDTCDYVEVVQVIDTGWSSDVALTGIQDAFERNNNINAIYSHSDFMMQGVIEGLRLKNKLVPAGEEGHIVTASIDADPVGLQGIRDGYIDMESENSPLITVAVALNVVLAELYGQDYASTYVLPIASVTKDNVDDPLLWGNIEKGAAPYVEQDVFPIPSRR